MEISRQMALRRSRGSRTPVDSTGRTGSTSGSMGGRLPGGKAGRKIPGRRGRSAIAIARRTRASPLPSALLDRLVEAILEGEGRRGEFSLAIVGDAEIRRLNRRYLGHDHATDVLAFFLAEEEEEGGEVVVSAETARREGERRGHGARAELLLYVAHGILHLLGYDDRTDAERKAMNARAAGYVRRVGVVLQG
jgi:probable rRNA maturation factor